MSKFKVISDGEFGGRNTKLFDPQGRDISDHVAKLVITIDADAVPKMEVTLIKPIAEIEIHEANVTFNEEE